MHDIGKYISKDSPKYAKLTVSSLIDATSILINHPKAGKIVPEFNLQSFRELTWGSYRIVYQIVDSERIDVLTVHHSGRSIRNTLKF